LKAKYKNDSEIHFYNFTKMETAMQEQNQTQENNTQMFIKEDYSDKSFAVYGNTKVHKDALKSLGGKFNKSLKIEGSTVVGWVFSKKAQEKVVDFVARTNNGESSSVSELPNNNNKTNDLPTVAVPGNTGTYQYVKYKIYRPSIGQNVELRADGKTVKGKIIKTESHNDIVDTVYIDFNGNTSLALICNGSFQVFGYMQKHSLFFSN
jgi:hypothetical protein